MRRKDKVRVGDIIKCHDKEEMLRIMTELAKKGIFTDLKLKRFGIEGYWLVVEKVTTK